MSLNTGQKYILHKYLSCSEEDFYLFLLKEAKKRYKEIKNIHDEITPDISLMAISEKFLKLYRREGDDKYLNIAKISRKAAHKMYRILLKDNVIKQNKEKFLTLIK